MSVSENPPAAVKPHPGRFQQLARLRRPEGQGHDRPGAPLLPLLKDDAPPVEGGDAAGHLQSKTQAARPLKQLPLIGFREKTRSVVPHGEDRPPAPAGQAQAGLPALSRRADGVGDQVEQQPPELGPVSMGEEAPYLLLIGKADASQRRQGRHLLPQLPAQPARSSVPSRRGSSPSGSSRYSRLPTIRINRYRLWCRMAK